MLQPRQFRDACFAGRRHSARSPERRGSRCRRGGIPAPARVGSRQFREAGRQADAAGRISYGENDAFFEAEGYFNAFLGCNTWTATALRQAGLVSGWWTALPWMLRASLWLHNDQAAFAHEAVSDNLP
ncbi:DUF2459 domain-containing protein [Rhizobium sp. T1470]|uniref:DUF2459 domain-containing protein n=1 Tax=unclassified Rhizobium TaxID=2613769 RepID=UPI00296F89B6|nr:DUF2459 domain-containing protein [Rhizobium sp. T1473]